MVILSLDQNIRSTGVSVIQGDKLVYVELVDTSKIKEKKERIRNVKKRLKDLIETFHPDVVAIEDIYFHINKDTFRKLSELIGVLENYLYEKELTDKINNNEFQYFILSPNQWRSVLGFPKGKRDTLKQIAIDYVKDRFNLDDIHEDIAEAVCIGLATQQLIKNKGVFK